MSDLLQRVREEIQNRRLLQRGDKILAAVSGGLDSMALLYLLHALAPERRWKIVVAHFNHQLRGRASEADERLVRKTAERLKLPFATGRADVKRFAAASNLSIEMAARKLRHEFFAGAARRRNISIVALAHHADDQVELFFLRLLRGSGGEGLAGMKWRSPSPAEKTIHIVRPLLGFSKSELAEFAGENKIPFRKDATNFSTDFLRNRIRNELLPLLRNNYQPGLEKAVLRLMDIVGAESEFAGEAAQAWRTKFRGSRGNEAQTEIGNRESEIGNKSEPPYVGCYDFNGLPIAIQRRVLQSQLAEAGVAPNFDLIESLRQSADCFVSVGPKIAVARDTNGKIVFRQAVATTFNDSELALNLGRTGRAEFGGRRFQWRIQERKHTGETPVPLKQKEFFDADQVGGEITLRHWRAGDRFQPIGLRSPAKLQDLFTNAKIPRERRRELVLAATARGEIYWVEGLRIGERFKLTPATERCLVWRWRSALP